MRFAFVFGMMCLADAIRPLPSMSDGATAVVIAIWALLLIMDAVEIKNKERE